MPNYGSAQAGSNPATPTVTALQGAAGQPGGFNVAVINPGDNIVLFNAENPAAPQSSIAFARGVGPMNQPCGIVFTIKNATASPTCTIKIQGSNTDNDADYQDLYTSTNVQFDKYADIGNFLFYRAKIVSNSSGAVTVIAQR